jgi:hypothetical protein
VQPLEDLGREGLPGFTYELVKPGAVHGSGLAAAAKRRQPGAVRVA